MAHGTKVLYEWLGQGGITVGQRDAQSRAIVCLECPNNVAGGAATEAVARAVKRQVELKNTLSLRVDGEKRLQTCGVCQCCLKLKIWLPLKNILPEPDEANNFPSNCWLITEQKTSP